METNTTYTASIAPRFEGLQAQYDVLVLCNRVAGICGPFTTIETVASLDEADIRLAQWGFVRTEEFGEVCANGFATAPVAKIDRASRRR